MAATPRVPESTPARQERLDARAGELSPRLPRPRGAEGADPGRAAALSVTGEQLWQDEKQRASRRARYELRRGLWRVSELKRTWKCGRFLHNDEGTGVRIKERSAYYDGLVTCGSIWSCPVCAARIRQRRAQEIESACLSWLAGGGGIEFPTFTLPHTRLDALADTLALVQKAWARVYQSRGVRALFEAYGVAGRIRATEITRGWNGWHPHAHVLLFTARPLTGDERELLRRALYKAWSKAVVKLGGAEPTEEHGVVLRPVRDSEVGNYLAKVQDAYGGESSVALELARSDAKKGRKKSRTPFDILDGAAAGVARDVALWHEYEAATKGRRAIEWSRGWKAHFGIDQVEDEDLAVADVDGDRIAWVPAAEWHALVRARREAHLLDQAEAQGAAGVAQELAALDVHPADRIRALADAKRPNHRRRDQ